MEDAYTDIQSCASLTIAGTHLLHDETIIDQTLETRWLLALSLAQQWFPCYVGAKALPDLWIPTGLSGYLAGLFFRRMFGNNEYKYRLLLESEWVCANDNGPPIYSELVTHPIDMQTELVIRKSPLVIYMMEKRVGETAFRKVINGLVVAKSTENSLRESKEHLPPPSLSLSSSSTSLGTKEGVDQTPSTKKLLKTFKLETGQDMKSFAEKWIFGKGCPKLVCGFWFNRKRRHTEFALRQVL